MVSTNSFSQTRDDDMHDHHLQEQGAKKDEIRALVGTRNGNLLIALAEAEGESLDEALLVAKQVQKSLASLIQEGWREVKHRAQEG